MKKSLVLTIASSLLIVSCQHDISEYTPTTDETTVSDFNFSTSNDVKLNITYNTQVAIPFSIYAENPINYTSGDDGVIIKTLKDSLAALYTGYTNPDGTFSKNITLPAYASNLYVYSPSYYAQNVIETSVSNGTVTATESSLTNAKTRSSSKDTKTQTNKIPLRNDQKSVDKWLTSLGTFNDYNGVINYPATNDGSSLYFTTTEVKNYYSDIPKILKVSKNCPIEYLTSQDLVVPKDEKISITMLGGNTCWNSTLAYYYYTGDAPTSEPSNIYVLFPNTQNGEWTNGISGPNGLIDGTAAILKYYGPNHDQAASDIFPTGTKLGFVLSCNSWGINTGNNDYQNKTQNFFSFTTPNISTGNFYEVKKKTDNIAYYKVNTAMMNYQDGTIVAFEDHYDDHNCTDVLYALKPQFGISDTQNKIKSLDTYTTETTTPNIFAFEDLWPSVGDYDMNDVIIYTTYSKTMQTSTINSDNYHYITGESFEFKIDENHAYKTSLKDGLAAWITGTNLSLTVAYKAVNATEYTTLSEADYTKSVEDGKTYIYLDKNVLTNMGATYKITLTHEYSEKLEDNTTFGCFLYRDDTQGRWEVHIPKEKPTSLLSDYYKAFLVKDNPYGALITKENLFYPFGLKLSGATESNIAPLLKAENETYSIDKFYKNYQSWVNSKGTENTDWYKK